MGILVFSIKVKLGMMKAYLFKIITVVFLFVTGTFCSVFAAANQNNLARVIVDPIHDNTYTINLIFENDYKGKAFIQKIEDGYYYVYLPDMEMNDKKVKINYHNRFDKKNIKINIEQKPFKNKDRDSNYLRLAVNMNSDYSIKLISKNVKEANFGFFSDSTNVFSLILVSLGLLLFLLIKKISKIVSRTNTYTSFPKSFIVPNIELSENTNFKRNLNLMKSSNNKIEETSDINNNESLKTADKSSFDCFNVNQAKDIINIDTDFTSVIKKTSNLLKNKAKIITNQFQTNPINPETHNNDVSEEQQKHNELSKIYKANYGPSMSGSEILSIIKLNDLRGFYLSKVEDNIVLFGYVKDRTFPLRRFRDLYQINLQARYYDKNANNDVFIVRVDEYKAMIEFSEDSIKELAVI